MKLQLRRKRRAISPFLATIILVVITLMIGGILYTQFRNIIVSQVKNPSMDLTDSNVAPNGETIVLSVKNDGNVPITLSKFLVTYGSGKNAFSFVAVGSSPANVTLVSSPSGGASMQPGDILTVQVTTTFPIPQFSTFTVTAVGDQLARAFNVQA
jgi:flagellin-like protein